MVQPMAEDLHWIQIEDFVEVFNRVYLTTDHTLLHKEGTTKRFVSKWIPGDFVGGSGGPPIIITTQTEAQGLGEDKDKSPAKDRAEGTKSAGLEQNHNNINTNNNNNVTSTAVKVIERYAMVSETFTDNPMYPFSVTEPTTLGVCLYQKDRRWNMGRLGDNARDVLTRQFASRNARLSACMEYPTGVAFLIVRLSGLKHRVTEFKLRKIVSGSEGLVFSNVANNLIYLLPGRYAIVPYTHTMLSRSMEYVLHCNYVSSQVEFEVRGLPISELCVRVCMM